MVTADNRVRLRKEVVDFQNRILGDTLLNSIFSVRQPGWFLHARSDHSDINLKTVEFLRRLEGFQLIVRSRDFPELSVVDYLLWALQRYILQGEKRYFAAMEHHYEQILDIYEDDGHGRLYTKEDRFETEKTCLLSHQGQKNNASSRHRANTGNLHRTWFYETLRKRSMQR